jgi:hypothetical protein
MKDEAVKVFLANENNKRTVEIIADLLNGQSGYSLAKKHGISKQAIYKIKTKYTTGVF